MAFVKHLAFLVILLAATVGIIAIQGSPKQGITKQKNSLDAKEAKQAKQTQPDTDKVVAPSADQSSAHNSDNQTTKSEDAETQRKLVKFTKWLVIVGALQFVALIVQALAFWYTLGAVRTQANLMKVHAEHFEKLARATANQTDLMDRQLTQIQTAGAHTENLAEQATRQANITQQQLELSQRPWVSVARIPQALQFTEGGAIVSCIFKFDNCGGSVTWNVSVWTELVPNEKDWRPVLAKLRDIPRSPANIDSDYGFVLFPNETVSQQQPTIMTRAALDYSIQNGSFKDIGKVGFYLVGCVDYRSFVSSEHYQTTFVDIVGYLDTSRGVVMGAFDPKQALYVPITLSPHGHGAFAT